MLQNGILPELHLMDGIGNLANKAKNSPESRTIHCPALAIRTA